MNFKKGTALYDEIDTCHKLFFDIFLNFLSAMVKVLKSVRAEDIKLFAVRGLQAVKIMGTVMYGYIKARKMRASKFHQKLCLRVGFDSSMDHQWACFTCSPRRSRPKSPSKLRQTL